MVTETKRTVKQWLEDVANTDSSTDQDSAKMQAVLRKIGFQSAVVVVGIVYLDGHGTLAAPPTSIHSMARMLLKEC